LVKDIAEFYDPLNRIGGKDWNKQVASHWLEASERHGMPVDARVFYDIRDVFTSTYPANIAVKAAEFAGKERGAKFLRRLREAAAAENKQIHKESVQIGLAVEVGLDASRFRRDLESGRAEKAFNDDLELCKEYGVTGFPTFLATSREGKGRLIRGYHPFEYFAEVFQELSPDIKQRKPEFSRENVLKFVKKYSKVATIEVALLFDISKTQAGKSLEELKEENIYRVTAGNDFFWTTRIPD
jgi:predicted DsbA family dithiol-disulfide isomerase